MTLRLGEIVIDCADHEVVVPFWLAAMGDYAAGRRQRAVRGRRAGRTGGRPPGRSCSRRCPSPRSSRTGSTWTCAVSPWPTEVARLTALGATFIAERTLGEDVRWTVMADPEGNEFCVSGGLTDEASAGLGGDGARALQRPDDRLEAGGERAGVLARGAPGSERRSAPPPGAGAAAAPPLGSTCRMPTMRTGRTCRPVWRASSPIPGWNGLISPVVVRVPSGNRTHVPAGGQEALRGGDGVCTATGPVEGERAQPGGHEPARLLGREVVGRRGGGHPAPVSRAQGQADRGEVEVAGMGGADERRPLELVEVLAAHDPRSHQEPADERPDEPRRDLAGDDRRTGELPAGRGRGPACSLGDCGCRGVWGRLVGRLDGGHRAAIVRGRQARVNGRSVVNGRRSPDGWNAVRTAPTCGSVTGGSRATRRPDGPSRRRSRGHRAR